MAKATDAQMLQRVKAVEKMLLNGDPRANILEFGTENYGVSEHAVEVYITEAYKRITAINKATIDEHKGWVLRNHLELIKMARTQEPPNLAEIRLNLVEVAKILNLNQITIVHRDEEASRMSDHELDAIIEAESVH